MGFATNWLESGTLFPLLINEVPDPETGIIVVVPAYNETSITELLNSLLLCSSPQCRCEVIIIINASVKASAESLKNNARTVTLINNWKNKNTESFFRVFGVNLGQPEIKDWGVGLARKAGMDEAAKRFNIINNQEGVIASLDADCTVSNNYFTALENELLKKKDHKGCSIYFEHPIAGDKFQKEIYDAVYQYELHLRYFYQALLFTGFPCVFHTVGSCMAVKSIPYVKAGGMNRRQAGEDFYFVQKIVSAGGYFSLNSTTVFPSPRMSSRVPFGTGATVAKMISDNKAELLTYNPLSFRDLSLLFATPDKLFQSNEDELRNLFSRLPLSLKSFLDEQIWFSKISEIKKNTKGLLSFRKRFFNWFNMFMIVKYLNYSHKSFFEKLPVKAAAEQILIYENIDPASAKRNGLLEYFRKLEKKL
jgi:hypothetical protein